MKQTLYIVTGMHRSGTSAVARMLQVFGIGLPGDLKGPAADNEKGFFEDGNRTWERRKASSASRRATSRDDSGNNTSYETTTERKTSVVRVVTTKSSVYHR